MPIPCRRIEKYRLLILFLITAVAFAQSAAQTPSYPGTPKWSVTPSVVRQAQGKYPGTLTVVLYLNNCQPDDSNGKTKVVVDSTKAQVFKITASGSGVTASTPTVGDCTLTAVLTIDGSAQPGDQLLVVSQAAPASATFTDDGVGILSLADATAGPTPGKPEVDVMWGVMSQHVCSDDFGNHLPNFLYCIEVKIGNNSAHSLQLAGIGFRRKPLARKDGKVDPTDPQVTSPNTSYQTARAVAQSGTGTTARNLIYSSLQAAGLVMASFTPFFHNTYNAFRWAAGTVIVGTALPQAVALVAPDLTLRELNNLDDQSFRDGKLIPNNTQVRMIVFIDRREVSEAIWATCKALYLPADNIANTTAKTVNTDVKIAKADAKTVKECINQPNPTIIKMALGDLIIVGNTVDFLQRVVVDTSVTSQEVIPPPTITVQPKTAPVAGGKAPTLSVTATGSGTLTYQWYQSISGAIKSAPIANETGRSYTPNPAPTGDTDYWVQVTNTVSGSGSRSVNSDTATITVPKAQ